MCISIVIGTTFIASCVGILLHGNLVIGLLCYAALLCILFPFANILMKINKNLNELKEILKNSPDAGETAEEPENNQ